MMTLSELWKQFKLLSNPQDLAENERTLLHRFLSEEQKQRERKRIENLLRLSGMKRIKLLKDFDWAFNPKIPKDKLLEFLNTQWLKKPANLILMGPAGVGKTHLATAFCHEAILKGYQTLFLTLFDLNAKLAKAKNLYNLIDYYARIPVLCLDEAHLLQTGPLEELRLLTNFKMDSYDPFVLVLSGQSDLRRTMEFAVMEPLNQRIAIRYHMPGLTPQETKLYVNHHLKLAGAKEPLLDEPALEAVHQVSFGIPRKIGTLVEQALTFAMFDHKRTVSAEMILKVKNLEG